MSTLTVSRSKKSGQSFEGTWPQVNLLPPEVTAARGLKHVKQWLGVVLLLVLVVAGMGYGYGTLQRSAADSELAEAQDAAARLQQEVNKYAEIQPIVTGLRNTTAARSYVMAPEVQWKQYLDAIATVLPANSRVTTFNVSQATLTMAPPAVPDVLTAQGIAAVQFTVIVPTLPDSAAFTDALNSIPGFYDATVASDTLGEVDGVVGYTLTAAVQVDPSALALRFPVDAGGQ